MNTLTLGSLFDGIGGFPLSGIYQGITPLWASEIEAFPIEVTKIRFPQMLHVGDITKLNGAELPVVDLITGGSPCQDLSVAGQRAGLAGERSGLFMEQIRLVKEMRCADERAGRTQGELPRSGKRGCSGADDAVRPRYMLWENVPGAFSSSNGEDFRAVLEETARIADDTVSIPRPANGAWKSAGCILGGKFSIAWRVLDAQHWSLAQRRRRIFLVADFAGFTAPQILFEQDRLLGDFTPSRKTWQGAAQNAESGTGNTSRCSDVLCFLDHGGERFDVNNNFVGTLKADIEHRQPMVLKPIVRGTTTENNQPVICLNDQGGSQMSVTENIVGTLRAQEHGHQPLLFDNHGKDCRYNGPLEIAPTVASVYGTGGNNIPLLMNDQAYCIAGNIIDRQDHNGGNGCGFQADISYTLTTNDVHAVYNRQGYSGFSKSDIVGTQCARQYKDATDLITTYQTVVGALCHGDEKGIGNQYVNQDKCIVEDAKLVRRLTPLECERLMGYPDGWTNIPKCSDSARYKALGNSVAIPCVEFILRGIAFFLNKFYQEQEDKDV